MWKRRLPGAKATERRSRMATNRSQATDKLPASHALSVLPFQRSRNCCVARSRAHFPGRPPLSVCNSQLASDLYCFLDCDYAPHGASYGQQLLGSPLCVPFSKWSMD